MQRQGRRAAAWLAVFGLLLHVLVAAIHVPAQADPFDPLAAWCGMDMPAGEPGSHAPDKAPYCPVCQQLHSGGAAILPAAPALPLGPDQPPPCADGNAAKVDGAVNYLAARPRAPPIRL